MLLAGLHDGNIAVYNLQRDHTTPCYKSNAKNGKHKDIVWQVACCFIPVWTIGAISQVKWASDNLDNYLNFYSVSGDGRVTNWTLVKSALWFNDKLLINFCKNLENINKEAHIDKLMGNIQGMAILVMLHYFRWWESISIQARWWDTVPGGNWWGPSASLHYRILLTISQHLCRSHHSCLQHTVEHIPAKCVPHLCCGVGDQDLGQGLHVWTSLQTKLS